MRTSLTQMLMSTSATVALLFSVPPDAVAAVDGWLPLQPCAISATPRVRIGAEDGDAPYLFQRVSDAAILEGGRIVVVDRGSKDLRIFNARGVHERTLGRKGSGPGEFTDPLTLGILGKDTIVVFDWDQQRLTVYDSKGALKRTVPVRPGITNASGFFGVFRSGAPYVLGVTESPDRKPTGFVPRSHRIERHGADGALSQKNLLTLADGTTGWAKESIRMATSPEFEPRASIAMGGDLLFVSEGATPTVKVFNARMQPVRTISWPDENRTVTKAELEKYREARLEGLSGDWVKRMTEYNEATPVSATFPAVGSLSADADGNVWVRSYTRPLATHHRWQQFDRAGKAGCTLTLPRNMTVLEFGRQYVMVATKGDDDVQTVDVFDIRVR